MEEELVANGGTSRDSKTAKQCNMSGEEGKMFDEMLILFPFGVELC